MYVRFHGVLSGRKNGISPDTSGQVGWALHEVINGENDIYLKEMS